MIILSFLRPATVREAYRNSADIPPKLGFGRIVVGLARPDRPRPPPSRRWALRAGPDFLNEFSLVWVVQSRAQKY
jgi:hypothetical protein